MLELPEAAKIALVSGIVLAVREAIGYAFTLWRSKPEEERKDDDQLIQHYDGVVAQYVAAIKEMKSQANAREVKLSGRIDALETAAEAKVNSHVDCLKLLSAAQIEITMLKTSRDSMRERLEKMENLLAGQHGKPSADYRG